MTDAPSIGNSGAISVLASLLEARTGQQIGVNRSWRIETALRPLLVSLGLDSVDALIGRLLDGQDGAIADRIIDALLNQETSFFRDAGVLEAAANVMMEGAATAARPPRIWCAACATGQEPLSMAMLFAEAGGVMPEILATDVSHSAVARARAASYNQFEIQRGLPIRRMVRWFDGDLDGHWAAKPALVNAISYRRHNLVADGPPGGSFDMILCRNVLFYITPKLREQILERLAGALRPGGLLLLGAGETVIGQSDRFRPSTRARGFYEPVPAGPSRASGGY